MALQLDLDTSPANRNLDAVVRQLREVSNQVNALGDKAPAGMSNLAKMAKASADSLAELRKRSVDVKSALVSLGSSQEFTAAFSKYGAELAKSSESLRQVLKNTNELAAQNRETARSQGALATAEQRMVNLHRELVQALGLSTTAGAQRNEADKARLNTARQLAAAVAKQQGQESLLKKQIELETSATGENIRQLQARLASMRAQETFTTRMAQRTAELGRQTNFLSSAEGREQIELQKRNASMRAAIGVEVDRAATLSKLRAELAFLRTAEARQTLELKQQIATQKQAILATTAHGSSMRLGAQLTTSMRAAMQGLRTNIGIYTSSTIVAATATFAMARTLRSTLQTGVDFSATMSRVRAAVGGSQIDFDGLTATVQQLGASTPLLTSQIAAAAKELGLIGLNAQQVSQALRPVVDFSILSGESLENAAKQSTDVMLIFGKNVDDLTHINDVMSVAATDSSASMAELTHAMTIVGPAAHTLGISLEDVAAAEETLANAGIRGGRAGTALRRMFVNLASPTTKGAQALRELGVQAFDFQGKAKSLTQILHDLQAGLSRLNPDERLGALNNIFGTRASSTIANLIGNIENFDRLRASLDSADGAAQRMVATMRDNLLFDVRDLQAGFESLQLTVFKDNAPFLRLWTERLREIVLVLGEVDSNGLTKFENGIRRVGGALEGLLKTYIAFRAIPLAKSLLAASAPTMALSLNLKSLTGSLGAVSTGARSVSASFAEARLASGMLFTEIRRGGAVGSAAMLSASAAARVLGTSIALVGRIAGALGWIGILATVGFAAVDLYKSLTGSGLPDKNEVKQDAEEVSAQYKALKDSLDHGQRVKQLDVLKTQFDTTSRAIIDISDKYKMFSDMAKTANTPEQRQAAEDLAASYRDQAINAGFALNATVKQRDAIQKLDGGTQTLNQRYNDAKSELDKMRYSSVAASGALHDQALKVAELRKEMNAAGDHKELLSNEALQAQLKSLDDFMAEARRMTETNPLNNSGLNVDNLSTLQENVQKSAEAVMTARDAYAKAAQAALDLDASSRTASVSQKALNAAHDNASNALNKASDAAKVYEQDLRSLSAVMNTLRTLDMNVQDVRFGMMPKAERITSLQNNVARLKPSVTALDNAMKELQTSGQEVPIAWKAAFVDMGKELQESESKLKTLTKVTRTPVNKDRNVISTLLELMDPLAAHAEKAETSIKSIMKAANGSDNVALLTSGVRFQQLSKDISSNAISGDAAALALNKWAIEALAANPTAQQSEQIYRLLGNSLTGLTQGYQKSGDALKDFQNKMDDRLDAMRRAADEEVAVIGMGSRQAELLRKRNQAINESAKEEVRIRRDAATQIRAIENGTATNKKESIQRIRDDANTQSERVKADLQAQLSLILDTDQRVSSAQQNMMNGVRSGFDDIMNGGLNMAGSMHDAITGLFDGMTNSIVEFGMTGKMSITDFAQTFVKSMMKMILQALIARAIGVFLPTAGGGGGGSLFSSISSGLSNSPSGINLGSGTGTLFSSPLVPSAMGNVFSRGRILPFARGGIVRQRATFGMGSMSEGDNPEAIMPIARGPDGRLGVTGHGLGGNNIQIVFNNNSGVPLDAKTSSPTRGPSGEMIFEVMVNKAFQSLSKKGQLDGPMARFGVTSRGQS